MTPKPRRKKIKDPPFEDCVSIDTPIELFQIQQLLRTAGAVLVDLQTGLVIKGFVDLPEIGLVDTTKNHPIRKGLGFIPPVAPAPPDYNFIDVDAILLVNQDYLEKGQPPYSILVVEDADIDKWAELAYAISLQFVTKVDGQPKPSVTIKVGSLAVSDDNDPKSAINAVLRRRQGYGFEDADAVSGQFIFDESQYFADEEDDDEGE